MKKPAAAFPKTYTLPYQLGVYLAVNAVPDCRLVLDGPNCSLAKADLVAGSHDLNSTLLSPLGLHRVSATMSGPLPQPDDPEKRLAAALAAAARPGGCGAVLVTGLPFLNLAGTDYDGAAAAAAGGAPVRAVSPASLEEDWLDGYDRALEALVSALPRRRSALRRTRVALAGYLYDRDEGDHRANLAELGRLLGLAGLELACVLPGGGPYSGWERALSAGTVISLPYGRRAAARLARLTGAALLETGLPAGFAGTSAWLQAARRAAGLKGPLPRALAEEERSAALGVSQALSALAGRNLLFAGDPHLYGAVAGLAGELGLRVTAAFLSGRSRPLPRGAAAPLLLFSPSADAAAAALAGLGEYERPSLAVCDYFAREEGLCGGAEPVELGFPSYTRHCLAPAPFLGYAGAAALAGRLLNAALRRRAGRRP